MPEIPVPPPSPSEPAPAAPKTIANAPAAPEVPAQPTSAPAAGGATISEPIVTTPEDLKPAASEKAPTPTPTELPPVPDAPSKTTSNYGPGVQMVSTPIAEPPPAAPPATAEQKPAEKIANGQSNNYQTLVGEVYQYRKSWRLRYAAIDSDDAHGGAVVLTGDHLEGLREGLKVRVNGAITGSDTAGTHYQVHRIEILEPAH